MNSKTKKRYCIFAAQYFPHLGGVERYTYNLARKLIEDGNEVVVVTSNVYKLLEYEQVDEIPVYRVPCWNLLAGRYPVLTILRSHSNIVGILLTHEYDQRGHLQ